MDRFLFANSMRFLSLLLMLSALDIKGTAAQTPIAIGAERRVDTGIRNLDKNAIAALAGGGFVVAWSKSPSVSGDGYVASARVYDAHLAPLGDAFVVATAPDSIKFYAFGLLALSNGGFVVYWVSESGFGGRIYDSAGSRVGVPFAATNDRKTHAVVGAAALAGNRFVLVWCSGFHKCGDVYAQVLEATGQALGPAFIVHQGSFALQYLPHVAAHPDGGFLVTWDSANLRIKRRSFDATGAAIGSETLVSTGRNLGSVAYPASVIAPSGRSVVVWGRGTRSFLCDDIGDVQAQRYDATGEKVGANFNVNQSPGICTFKLVPLRGGRSLVAWLRGDNSYGRVLSAGGLFGGGEFQFNTTATGTHQLPFIAPLRDGGLVAVWNWSGGSVLGQRFDAVGAKVGDEFVLDVESGEKTGVVAAGLSDGSRIAASWIVSSKVKLRNYRAPPPPP